MFNMERIRVRIIHENKPFDGVFNQSDDMILLSLFIRVITGSAPRKVVQIVHSNVSPPINKFNKSEIRSESYRSVVIQ